MAGGEEPGSPHHVPLAREDAGSTSLGSIWVAQGMFREPQHVGRMVLMGSQSG